MRRGPYVGFVRFCYQVYQRGAFEQRPACGCRVVPSGMTPARRNNCGRHRQRPGWRQGAQKNPPTAFSCRGISGQRAEKIRCSADLVGQAYFGWFDAYIVDQCQQ
jgi:hypothetical protein